jgi:hypothetical protein
MKSITLFRRYFMSHEQNMHHHLIYFANAQHITRSQTISYSVLTSTQIYIKRWTYSLANPPHSTFNSVPNVAPGIFELLQHSSTCYITNGTFAPFFTPPNPSVMSVSYFSSATQSVHVDNTYQAYLSDPDKAIFIYQSFISTINN